MQDRPKPEPKAQKPNYAPSPLHRAVFAMKNHDLDSQAELCNGSGLNIKFLKCFGIARCRGFVRRSTARRNHGNAANHRWDDGSPTDNFIAASFITFEGLGTNKWSGGGTFLDSGWCPSTDPS